METGLMKEMESGLMKTLEAGPMTEMETGLLTEMETGLVKELETGLVKELETGLVTEMETGLITDMKTESVTYGDGDEREAPMNQVMKSLNDIHSANIFHYHRRPWNIMAFADGWQVIDFALSCALFLAYISQGS
eukprot:gene6799-13769_t